MRKVLIVDDEPAITDGLVALFELETIEASGAYDRTGAESKIAGEFFPLILADLRLGSVEEGLELVKAIRRLSPDSKIATLTGYATPEIEASLMELGSSVLLHKPMEPDEILTVISEMLAEIEREAAAQVERSGGEVDLVALYENVRRILWAIPQRRYHFTREETEELVQQAWLLYLEKRESISMARPWLAGTVANLCKQTIHSKSRSREKEREILPQDEAVGAADGRSHISTLMVQQALARLDERSRLLCTLIGIEGWSYEEVSSELALPIGSIGPLYIRAKKKLRTLLTTTH